MSDSDKDRLGSTLQDREKAEEDRFFAEREREILDKLKKTKAAEDEATLREAVRMRCPKCGERLGEVEVSGVNASKCPACHGIWLDEGELDKAVQFEKHTGWFTRYLERIRQPSRG